MLSSKTTVRSEKPNMEEARTSLHSGETLKVRGKRVSHLIFDLLRAATRPIRKDDHLVFAEIRNGINRGVAHCPDAPCNDQQRAARNEEAIPQGPVDQPRNNAPGRRNSLSADRLELRSRWRRSRLYLRSTTQHFCAEVGIANVGAGLNPLRLGRRTGKAIPSHRTLEDSNIRSLPSPLEGKRQIRSRRAPGKKGLAQGFQIAGGRNLGDLLLIARAVASICGVTGFINRGSQFVQLLACLDGGDFVIRSQGLRKPGPTASGTLRRPVCSRRSSTAWPRPSRAIAPPRRS